MISYLLLATGDPMTDLNFRKRFVSGKVDQLNFGNLDMPKTCSKLRKKVKYSISKEKILCCSCLDLQ